MLSAIKNSFQPLGINTKQYGDTRWWLGMLLVVVLAWASVALSKLPIMQSAQFSSLTIGIVLGIIVGNSVFSRIATRTDAGVDFAKSILLNTPHSLILVSIVQLDLMEISVLCNAFNSSTRCSISAICLSIVAFTSAQLLSGLARACKTKLISSIVISNARHCLMNINCLSATSE